MEEFVLGQRWVSNAELSLGLGTLVNVEHRIITIDFIASGESRTYAKENAPLTRVIYDTDEQVNTIDGESIKITQCIQSNGLATYKGLDEQGVLITLEESQLDHFVQLNRPAERLFMGQVDKNLWFELRYQTQQKIKQFSHSDLSGLTGCRTSLIAHQLFIAHEVANRYAPRVLLADEVGLGKTIEAGLIIHHQLLHERVQRVLIIVPENLMHQWLVEMLRRFNLKFSIFNQQRCQIEDGNPFLEEQLVLCSLEFLTQNQHVFSGEWDLLVVDEAHHLQWSAEESSHEYQLVEQLTKQTKGVLLLTATPEQLGVESHFARLRLLDPDRFPDYDAFIAEEESYQPIAQAIDDLLYEQESERESGQEINTTTNSLLKQFLIQKNTDADATNKTIDNISNRHELIAQLLDQHGTGRVLFRNTRNAIKGFPGRNVIAHPQPLPEVYLHALQQFCTSFLAISDSSDGSDTNDANKSESFSNLVLFPELLYQTIMQQEQKNTLDWTQFDPRVAWLTDCLLEQRQSTENNKILVITAHASTAIALAEALKIQSGLVAAVFHEGLSLLERDRAAAFFAESENGSSVLICSEIGSEGRNFQFAHDMVLFDLPLNPDLLEQRIGRLDRIGQTQTIKIHIPYLQNTAQEDLFNWYHSGLNAFEQTCPAGNNVFTQMQTQLQSILMNATTNDSEQRVVKQKAIKSLIQSAQSMHKELNDALHKGRDRLLEYNSCRQPEADQLKLQADKYSTDEDLYYYMDSFFNVAGIEHSDHSEHCYIIAPGEQMIHPFPGLTEDAMTITYDRNTALENEDIQFFTWEHPMVKNAMEMISSSEMGNTAITTLDSKTLEINIAPGSALLECIFILETTTHQDLQADRYLPSSTIRLLINEQYKDLAKVISSNDIIHTANIKRRLAQQIIKLKEEVLQEMISQAEQKCLKQTPQLLSSARKASQETLNNEIKRLTALAQVNPNIRTEEIDFYAQQLKSLDILFASIKPRLDALRVIIVT